MSRNYEIAFLIRDGKAQDLVVAIKEMLAKANIDFIKDNDKMGIRELAYVIQKNREKFHRAFYYFVNVKASPENVSMFEESIKYNTDIIRHMVILGS